MIRALRYFSVIGALTCQTYCLAEPGSPSGAVERGDNRILAVDVLLLPDQTLVQKAEALNARLRENYPKGYTLGSEQVPHITLVHRYVREKDLPAIQQALTKLLSKIQPLEWQLTADGYTSALWSGLGLTTIHITPTPELMQLQEDVVAAVKPFHVSGGTAAAFSTTRELPKIDPEIIDYVDHFVPRSSGKSYSPHVTVGAAHEDFVKRITSEPFEKFSFKPAGIAIYQLGNFGTAQKKLWEWNGK
jgi:hypothetical protein